MCKWYVSLEKFEDACKTADLLAEADPESKYPKNFKRQHCVDDKIAEDLKSCVLVEIVSSSESKEIEVKEVGELEGCYLGGSNIVSAKEIQVGQLVSLAQCLENMKMGEAVYRITKISRSNISLEPWYWSILINDEPAECSFIPGDNWIVEW